MWGSYVYFHCLRFVKMENLRTTLTICQYQPRVQSMYHTDWADVLKQMFWMFASMRHLAVIFDWMLDFSNLECSQQKTLAVNVLVTQGVHENWRSETTRCTCEPCRSVHKEVTCDSKALQTSWKRYNMKRKKRLNDFLLFSFTFIAVCMTFD